MTMRATSTCDVDILFGMADNGGFLIVTVPAYASDELLSVTDTVLSQTTRYEVRSSGASNISACTVAFAGIVAHASCAPTSAPTPTPTLAPTTTAPSALPTGFSPAPTANRVFTFCDSSWLDDESRFAIVAGSWVSGSEYDGVGCLLEPTTTNGVSRIWIPSATSWTDYSVSLRGINTWLQRDAWLYARTTSFKSTTSPWTDAGYSCKYDVIVAVDSSTATTTGKLMMYRDQRHLASVTTDFYKDVWFTQTFTLVDDALSCSIVYDNGENVTVTATDSTYASGSTGWLIYRADTDADGFRNIYYESFTLDFLPPARVPTPSPTPVPSFAPTRSQTLWGVVISATNKDFLGDATVYVMPGYENTDTSAAVATATTNTLGYFVVDDGVVPSGTYTVLAEADGYMTNWASDIGGSSFHHVLIVLPERQLASDDDATDTATVVLQWGKMSTDQADYDSFLGTPEDLDLWVQFEVDGDTGESCLVNYAAPACGDAELVLSDALCCIDERLAGDYSIGTHLMYGVETVRIASLLNVSYTAWIGNFLNDQPVQMSDAAITVFVRDARLTRTVLPAPCNYTDDAASCPDYDAPLAPVSDGSGLYPFAYPDANRAQAQYARALCVDVSNASAIVHETQRFYSATAFGHLSTSPHACPPAFDDCLADGKDGYYWCSNEIADAVITCPGGVASAAYCEAEGAECAYGPFSTDEYSAAEATASLMCAATPAATPAPTPALAAYSDAFCFDAGAWILDTASQYTFDASDGCALRAEWITENRNYGWLDPSACCGTPGGWTDVRVTATVQATNMPSSNKGRVVVIARDPTGPSDSCSHNTPQDGYGFTLDFANQETSVNRRDGCGTRRDIEDPSAASLSVGVWYTIVAEMVGTTIRFYLDGNLVHNVQDSSWTAGSVGLYCFRIDCALESIMVEEI